MHVESRCPYQVSSLIAFPLYSLRQGLSLNLKLAGLTSQLASKPWDPPASIPHHPLLGCPVHTDAFSHLGSGVQLLVFMLTTEPSPQSSLPQFL